MGLESLRINRGILILVGVNSVNCLISFTQYFALLFYCRSWSAITPNPFHCVRSFVLEKDKLNGTNYADWIRNLRIVLRAEKKEDVLDTPLPEEPADDAPTEERTANRKACDNNLEVSCLMLACMEPDIQM